MEKKTIGRFIAALRKANGLTQRELAEKLCVSDKAVSRWERDETAPDLSLIPVIAEIFGVSSDELLRGERAASSPSAASETYTAAKVEKQLHNLLRRIETTFRIRSIAAGGIALAGVLAAAICNFIFLRAFLGFLLACVFYLTAAVCEAIFLVLAFSSLADDFDGEALEGCKRAFITWGCHVFTLIATLAGASLPLSVFPYVLFHRTDGGLTGFTWPLWGTIFGAAAWLLAAAAAKIVKTRLSRAPVSPELQRKRNRLKLLCAGFTVAAMLLTLPLHLYLGTDCILYSDSLIFDSYEDFKAYMAIEAPAPDWAFIGPAAPVPDGPITYYDSDGKIISREEAYTETIVNAAGEVVCEYLRYNENAGRIRYSVTETCLPIQVYTLEQLRQANSIMRRVNGMFFLLYPVEAAAGLAVYFLKRKNLK